jgi:regulatory protein
MKQFPARADDARGAAKPRREDIDSSPRPSIASLRKGASGTAIVAVGGSSFILRISQAQDLGLDPAALAPGAELDEASLGILALAAEAYEAEKRALALLARAEQSAFMLGCKLEARGLSKKAVRIALERLQAEGLLSDRRFAEAYAAARLSRRAEGPSSLLSSLRGRGVDADTAKAAIAAILGPEPRRAALAKAAEKELRRSGGDREAARRRLRALGFKSEEISGYFDPE